MSQPDGAEKLLQEINSWVDLVSNAMFLAGKIGQVYLTMFCNNEWNEHDKIVQQIMIHDQRQQQFVAWDKFLLQNHHQHLFDGQHEENISQKYNQRHQLLQTSPRQTQYPNKVCWN